MFEYFAVLRVAASSAADPASRAAAATYESYCYYYYYFFKANQHKAAGRKTRLDIQNYGCNSNLLCDHGAVERNHSYLLLLL